MRLYATLLLLIGALVGLGGLLADDSGATLLAALYGGFLFVAGAVLAAGQRVVDAFREHSDFPR